MNSIEKSKFCLAKSYTYSLSPLKFNRKKCTTGSNTCIKKSVMRIKEDHIGIYSETQIQSAYSTQSKQSLNFQQTHGYVTDRSDRLDDWLMESAREYLRPPIKSLTSKLSSTIVPQISHSHCYIKNKAILGCLLLDRVYEQNSPNASGVTFTIDQLYENHKLKGSRYTKRNRRDKNDNEEATKALHPQKSSNNQGESKILHSHKNETNMQHSIGTEDQIISKIDGVCEQTETLPLASYVECPSEILQRMTNLELPGYDTLSSITGTDVEIREDYSSNYIIEQDDSSLVEGQSEDWIRFENSNRNNVTEVSKRCDDKIPIELYSSHEKNDKVKDMWYSHDYRHHYCWRREVTKHDRGKIRRDYRGRCINCQRYRIRQIQAPRPLAPFSKRVSVGRICRRRRNVARRSTQERWVGKTKSQCKMRKEPSDLQRPLFWENADAQTAVLLYHEAGTDAVVKELKSTDITATPQLFTESWSQMETNLITLALGNKEVAGEKCRSKPTTTSAIPDQITEPKNDTATNEPIITKTDSITSLKKGTDKLSEQGTSLSIYKLQMIDRVIENVDSLILISKNDTSSASTTLIGTSNTMLKIQDEDIQTDVVNYSETETYVNYNQSMDTPYCISTCSDSGSFCKPGVLNTDCETKSFSTVGITTSDMPKRSVNITGTQITPITSINEEDGILTAEIVEDSSCATSDEWSLDKANSSSPESDNSGVIGGDSNVLSTHSNSSTPGYLLAKDVSTEITSKEMNIEMETSRYLCCKQYETHTHGTSTGSSLHSNVNEKNTSTTGIAVQTDVGISAFKCTPTKSFGGGPTSQIPYTKGASTGGLVSVKSFNGGSHLSLRSFVADVRPQRATVSTSTRLPSKNKATGINSVTNGRMRRPITVIQNDSETDLLWNLDGSLFDMLLRSCSSDVATQVLQIFANSRDKKKVTKNSLVERLVDEIGAKVPHTVGNSFDSEVILVDQSADAKPLPGPATSKGVCTSDYLAEVSAQTSGLMNSSQIRNQSNYIVNKLFKSQSSPLNVCNKVKANGCICVKQEIKPQQLKEVSLPDCESCQETHTQGDCAAVDNTKNAKIKDKMKKTTTDDRTKCLMKNYKIKNTTTDTNCKNCTTDTICKNATTDTICKNATSDDTTSQDCTTVDNKSNNSGKDNDGAKQEKKSKSNDIATSVRSVAKKRKASPLISPNGMLRVNAGGKFTQRTDCSFVCNSPPCYVNATHNDTYQDVLPQGLSGNKKPKVKKFRTVGLTTVPRYVPARHDKCQYSNMTSEFIVAKGRLHENMYGRTTKAATQTSHKDWKNKYEKKIRAGPIYDKFYQNIPAHRTSHTKIYKKYKVKINPPSIDDNGNCSLNISNVFKIEACTMKPSNYSNAASQTYYIPSGPVRTTLSSSCILSPALSLTDICGGRDKNDLRTVYFMLSAIEGRIRRLKRNVRSR